LRMDDDFAAFVRLRMPALLRFGHALTGNPHDALDLVQTALERTGVRWRSVRRGAGDPEAYVRRAMVNTHVSRWRRLRRETLVRSVPDHPADDVADAALDRAPLWQALRALPPRQRAVVVLRYYEDMSEAQIADVLGVTPGTVKSQNAKAMVTLRRHLAPTTHSPSGGSR
jgi:RNA polymerase sigma-70 factor (sigma-E family)